MLQRMVTRRAVGIRTLLDQGMFDAARVPLRNGGTLPANLFARIALGDLDRLSTLALSEDNQESGMSWRQLGEDVELLHEVALERKYTNIHLGLVPASPAPVGRGWYCRRHPARASLLGPPARSTGLL